MSIRTLQKYASHVRKGIPLYGKGGKPALFDEESCDVILDAAAFCNYVMVTSKYRKLLNKQAVLTATRRNIPLTEHLGASKSTVRRLEVKLCIRTGNGEETCSMEEIPMVCGSRRIF